MSEGPSDRQRVLNHPGYQAAEGTQARHLKGPPHGLEMDELVPYLLVEAVEPIQFGV